MNSTLFCPTSISPVIDTRANLLYLNLVNVTKHTALNRTRKHTFKTDHACRNVKQTGTVIERCPPT